MNPHELQASALELAREAVMIVGVDAGAAPHLLYANAAAHAVFRGRALDAGAPMTVFDPDDPAAPEQRLAALVAERAEGAVIGAAGGRRLEARARPLPAADGADAGPYSAIYLRVLSRPGERARETDLALAALDAAAEELAVTDAGLRAVADAFPGVVLILDADAAVRLASGADLRDFGLSADQVEDGGLGAALPGTLSAALAPMIARAFDGERTRFDFNRADRIYEGVAGPARLATGRLGGVLIALHDVSDARLAFDALRRAEHVDAPATAPTRRSRWGL